MVELGFYTRATQAFYKPEALRAGGFAKRRNVYDGRLFLGHLGPLKLGHEQKPFHAHAKAHAAHFRPAKLRHQPIVAASPAYGAGVAIAVGDDLKHGFRVIIQAPHDERIDLIGDFRRIKAAFQLRKVAVAIVTQAVEDTRRTRGDFLAALFLTVEDAKGVFFKARFAGIAKRVVALAEIFLELFVVRRAAYGAADAVDVEGKPLEARAGKHVER